MLLKSFIHKVVISKQLVVVTKAQRQRIVKLYRFQSHLGFLVLVCVVWQKIYRYMRKISQGYYAIAFSHN